MPSRFSSQEHIGTGGMGTVYRVFDEELGTSVAAKTLNVLSADQIYYLKTEFRAVADIAHPNLVRLYELFQTPEGCFFTMELVSGRDLVSFVRQHGTCDTARLTAAAGQLASAIRTIHTARKLHRDIKPSNVLVTDAGRVVLLDFGLIAPFQQDSDRTRATSLLEGTIGYMPPEQALGAALDASADWYAFGATLFEAATGALPFEPRRSMLRLGADDGPPRVRDSQPDFPPELDDLIGRLLSSDPAVRPDGENVLAAFAGVSSRPPISSGDEPLIGRDQELGVLRSALEEVTNGRAVTVHLHGPSGVGKSELARRFTDDAERSGALVLRGRCHPLELVPFNALDGMIDELSQWLQPGQARGLPPGTEEHVINVARLFPVLARVHDSISSAAESVLPGTENDVAARGARSLRELFRGLGQSAPLVVWLDDIHWGDEDSGRVLRELVRGPNAPNLLLLLTYRTEDSEGSRALSLLRADDVQTSGRIVDVSVNPLSHEDTMALVSRSAKLDLKSPPIDLFEIVRQARGIPFFAHEIARALAEATPADLARDAGLDRLLIQRILGLDEPSRRLVEVVCVAGGPLETEFLLRAASLGAAARPLLFDLERDRLVRSTQTASSRAAEVYHHRVRDSVLSVLDDARRRSHHGAIAAALLAVEQPNYPRVVEHLDAAEDLPSVRRHVVAAARQAEAVFAFDRAARLYARALEVGDVGLTGVSLQECLATALAGAGRGREAGGVFETAAALADSESAPPARSLSLRRRAAEQYLKSWQREDATRSLNAVVGPLGIKMPKGRGAAVFEILANRGYVWWRGLEPRAPSKTALADPLISDRLGVLLLLMQVYGMTEHTYGFAFGSRLLREGLSAGDSELLLNGLACEGVAWAALAGGFPRREADKHLAAIERMCLAEPTPYRDAVLHQCRGIASHFRGDFTNAVQELELSFRGLRSVSSGLTVDVATNFAFRLAALGFLGRLKEQVALLDGALADAQARGDDYLLATCGAGHATLGWLMTGRQRESQLWAERVLALAPPGFSSQHFQCLVTLVNVDLLERRGSDAWLRIERQWRAVKDNQFLTLSCIGEDLRQTRARAALAAAAENPGGVQGTSRKALLAVAASEARQLEKSALPCASGWARLLRAGIARVRGDAAQAQTLLGSGAAELANKGLSLYAAATRHANAMLTESLELRAGAEQELKLLGVTDAGAASRALVPGVA